MIIDEQKIVKDFIEATFPEDKESDEQQPTQFK